MRGDRSDAIRVATHEVTSQHTPAITTETAGVPTISASWPPTKTPSRFASEPPTVTTEFAASRSSAAARRGTTAPAVDSWNRFTEITASAPR